MKILILGGTGSIGRGIVKALILRGHDVLALARSQASADQLRQAGATPLMGDIRQPDEWIGHLKVCDGVVQAAATWDDDMERVDRALVEALLPSAQPAGKKHCFIPAVAGYTATPATR